MPVIQPTFIFNFMLVLSAHDSGSIFFVFLTITMKKKSPHSSELCLFCCVLEPSADSGQCRFNVTMWIEQSSRRQWPIFSVQIAFHFSSHCWLNRKTSGPLSCPLSNRPVFLKARHQNTTSPLVVNHIGCVQTADPVLAWQHADGHKHAKWKGRSRVTAAHH